MVARRWPAQHKVVEVEDDGRGPARARYRMRCRRCGATSGWFGTYGQAAHEQLLHRYRRC